MRFNHMFLGVCTLRDYEAEASWDSLDPNEMVEVVDQYGEVTTARVRTLTPIEETPPASTGSLNDLADEIMAINVSKGFHPPAGETTNVDRNLMLIVGELAEAQEELRDGHSVDEVYFSPPKLPSSLVAEVGVERAEELMAEQNAGLPGKPEGFGVEIADALIRILGMTAELGLDIDALVRLKMEFNRTRPYKHGKSF